jgi:hypothetical protein
MIQRLVSLAVGVLSLALLGTATAADEHKHADLQKCAQACADCMRECESCFAHCTHLVAQGEKKHAKTLRTCRDCADHCALAAKVVGRNGPTAVATCELCAKVCELCAKACEEFADDLHMKKCARACRDCLKACKDMVEHAGHSRSIIDPKRSKGKLYGLCVGVNNYTKAKAKGGSWPDLAFCVADARAFHNLLLAQKNGGLYEVDAKNLKLMDDTRGPVTSRMIKVELEKIRDRAKPDDTVILFLSGHGDADANYSPGSFYFVCSDNDTTKPATRLTSKDLESNLCATQGRKVLFLDVDRSGALIRSTPLRDLNRDGARLLIFSACKPEESALEPVKGGQYKNGLFTHCVIEAVRKSKAPLVSAPDIRAHLRVAFPKVLKSLDQPPDAQNPVYLLPERGLNKPLFVRP